MGQLTVGILRKMLEGVDDNVNIYVPINKTFDGGFYQPCHEESGFTQLGFHDEEEVNEMELLNKPIPTEDAFIIVPCGFSDENSCEPNYNMN